MAEQEIFFLHGLYLLLSYCNGQYVPFYRFISFAHYVYMCVCGGGHCTCECGSYRGWKIESLGAPDTLDCASCGFWDANSGPLQEQNMLSTCLHLTKTIHGGEAIYPCLVSDCRELQFSLLPTTGDVRYLFLMSFFSSKLWLLFTNWLRDFIMSFVVYEHASVEMTNGVSLSSC